MAATIFSEQLARRGLSCVVRVTSAGTTAVPDGPIDEQTVQVLIKHGYVAPADHRAAQLDNDHLTADLVVALGPEHVSVLQRRGVSDDRIRYMEVRNPCYSTDFENAYAAIQAAMPALHAWVNARLPLAQQGTTIGWRFWAWRPGDALRGPFSGRAWQSTTAEVWCRTHQPPAADCCGFFADLEASDSISRARAYAITSKAGLYPLSYSSWDHLVVGKVALAGVVPYRPPPIARHGKVEIEWLGCYGTLVELGLLDTRGAPKAITLAEELAQRYGVPVRTD